MSKPNAIKKHFAVVLSGCGHRDGTEITEAVSALVALTEFGATYDSFAPDREASAVHALTGEPLNSARNMLTESARIARGSIKPLNALNPEKYDGLIFPGGYGAALNLCTFGREGAKCSVLPEVEKCIQGFFKTQKPILGICIAPALLARVLGPHGITVTIGTHQETAGEIRKTGAQHQDCPVDDFVSDRDHKIITTPAYMYDNATPFQVFTGVRRAIKELVEMA